ncbi:MAG: hypothetical protein ISS44_00760 [Candidatus Omnitrophica bacterium]|nr:hypothetical protein [Candidatus Omnitrophota bacterium]
MYKFIGIFCILAVLFCFSGPALSEQEQSGQSEQSDSLTITTYYPSPYGDYNELMTHSNTNLATDEGDVGIGTTSPTQKLDVAGFVKGQSGLCIGEDCRSKWPGIISCWDACVEHGSADESCDDVCAQDKGFCTGTYGQFSCATQSTGHETLHCRCCK